MNRSIAESVGDCIVVNNSWTLRSDALALCANDRAWWNKHKAAHAFKGRKFSTNPPERSMVEKVRVIPGIIETGTNSGLLALHVALTVFQARRVFLHGFDMKGGHFFGPHVGLPNTTPGRFEVFKQQFARYLPTIPQGVEVLNATPGSALKCFPFAVAEERYAAD